ncbi:MAG TPA: hypothetical protein PLD62_04380 [Candidatus Cloacimonadota bacterium]|nr:hypothetical protein [Candidatus Cloacimonadota bacterium]
MKNYNLNLIRKKHSYSSKDICNLLDVAKVTILNWQKKGLHSIDEQKLNKLFYGEHLKEFLNELMQKRRVQLQENEFYCLACHKAVKGMPKFYRKKHTGKKLGHKAVQVLISSKCEICGSKLRRFSSENITDVDDGKVIIKKANEEIKDEQIILPLFEQEEA